jgi:hypothetical protein
MQQFMSNNITTDEVERATASIEDKENHDFHTEMLLSINAENCTEEQETSGYTPLAFSPQQCISLKQSAEEILSGIRKNVEVQYLNPVAQESQTQTGMHTYIYTQIAAYMSYAGMCKLLNSFD